MNKQNKIQSLVIRQLQEYGTLDIRLPDGIILEIGTTHSDKRGNLIKSNDYCYVSASREDKKILLDSYNLGLSFAEEDDKILFEESAWDDTGRPIHRVDVI